MLLDEGSGCLSIKVTGVSLLALSFPCCLRFRSEVWCCPTKTLSGYSLTLRRQSADGLFATFQLEQIEHLSSEARRKRADELRDDPA